MNQSERTTTIYLNPFCDRNESALFVAGVNDILLFGQGGVGAYLAGYYHQR